MHSADRDDVQKVCDCHRCASNINSCDFAIVFQMDFLNAFVINTEAEGHNSGRTYYLQADSKDMCLDLVKTLKTRSKRARERAAAQTRIARLQLRVRKIFHSYWFQFMSATLIIAVSFNYLPFRIR